MPAIFERRPVLVGNAPAPLGRPADHEVYAFLTTEPNVVVVPIHKKAIPVILTEPGEIETWLSAPWDEAKAF